MTTKFLDNKFTLSKFYCHGDGVSQEKTAFWDDFPLCPQFPPSPLKKHFFLSARRL